MVAVAYTAARVYPAKNTADIGAENLPGTHWRIGSKSELCGRWRNGAYCRRVFTGLRTISIDAPARRITTSLRKCFCIAGRILTGEHGARRGAFYRAASGRRLWPSWCDRCVLCTSGLGLTDSLTALLWRLLSRAKIDPRYTSELT